LIYMENSEDLEALLDESLFQEHTEGGYWTIDEETLANTRASMRGFFINSDKGSQSDIKFKVVEAGMGEFDINESKWGTSKYAELNTLADLANGPKLQIEVSYFSARSKGNL